MSEMICAVIGCGQVVAEDYFVCPAHLAECDLDTWDRCTRCGCEVNDADVWPEFCPRCQQLAALEAEIGRLSVGQSILDRVAERLATSDKGRVPTILNLAYSSLVDERMHQEACYRKLHAESVEGGE